MTTVGTVRRDSIREAAPAKPNGQKLHKINWQFRPTFWKIFPERLEFLDLHKVNFMPIFSPRSEALIWLDCSQSLGFAQNVHDNGGKKVDAGDQAPTPWLRGGKIRAQGRSRIGCYLSFGIRLVICIYQRFLYCTCSQCYSVLSLRLVPHPPVLGVFFVSTQTNKAFWRWSATQLYDSSSIVVIASVAPGLSNP